MDQITMPEGAKQILQRFEQAGFRAYVVGGCVRDSLLGKTPQDWDICTPALPEQTLALFADLPVIPTGLRHGTVGVRMDDGIYEVTTFRRDGVYSDSRHPDQVEFIGDLRADLARRDFTVNAMAYHPRTGIADYFGGRQDLQGGVIRCVGNARERFSEDALRIMRALRFAATYAFEIEAQTAAAIRTSAPGLREIANERIFAELCRLLTGVGAGRILLDYPDVAGIILPELAPCVGFEQNSRYHQYTVYEHIVRSVESAPSDELTTRLALLLHDAGKPCCYTVDERGGHFHGHAAASCKLAEQALLRLRCSNQLRADVLQLIEWHDLLLEPNPRQIKRWLNRFGVVQLRRLLDVQWADTLAHAAQVQPPRLEKIAAVRQMLDEVIAQADCFCLRDLKLNGSDLLALGVPEGKRIGSILQALLDDVIAGTLDNDRQQLLARAKTLLCTQSDEETVADAGRM